jgi:plastocyanin
VGDDFFSPRDTVVQVNGTVTWSWTGVQPHTVSLSGGPESGSPAGTPQTSGTYARMFTTPGKFSYFCRVHGNMTGTVTVVH